MNNKLISKKKPSFKINKVLDDYLASYRRKIVIPIFYEDLKRFSGSVSVYNNKEIDTLWVRVFYSDFERKEIDENLKKVYNLLHSDGNTDNTKFLSIDAIDYCTFGNSKPFRVKIRNILNDNFTYFYVKKADASRIYGLELEHILSPYNLNFLVFENTLIEEHITGIPGDEFFDEFFAISSFMKLRNKAITPIGKLNYVLLNHQKVNSLVLQNKTVTYYITFAKEIMPTESLIKKITRLV